VKFLEFASLLKGDSASIAIFSTFQFDPDFFERRLLPSSALAKARRILIFMDARQWSELLQQDFPTRHLNRRYLVVPVRCSAGGVFHPKLSLLVTDRRARVLCGSNNLTRAGSSSNLELLNCIDVDLREKDEEGLHLVREAFAFFQRACEDTDEAVAKLASQWLEDLQNDKPWIRESARAASSYKTQLVHTYDGSLWVRLVDLLEKQPPKTMLIISPYYDADAEMVHRVCKKWPKCRLELVVQQNTTNLDVSRIKKLASRTTLSELRQSTRRLHAKLVAWKSGNRSGCLVGSANFTTAAFDARNVETNLLISDAENTLDRLFDRDLNKRTIAPDDFEAGTGTAPEPFHGDPPELRLKSALLSGGNDLRVNYEHRLKPSELVVAIRAPGDDRPRVVSRLPNRESGSAIVKLPEETLSDVQGTILASLIAKVGKRRLESPPIWVIQEERLTYEPSSGGPSSGSERVVETGEGLAEYLDELGKRDGVAAVIEYLRHLNIRFSDGGRRSLGKRRFQLRIHDPFHPDVNPDWLLTSDEGGKTLEEAIYDFADRHETQRLRRHAGRGNVNGIENFLNIHAALVRLLYVYHARGIIPAGHLVGRYCRYLRIATCGIDEPDNHSEGYLYKVRENLKGDQTYLKDGVKELNFFGHLWVTLLIAQSVRSNRDSPLKRRKRPGAYLPSVKRILETTHRHLRMQKPSQEVVVSALRSYGMFTEAEIAQLAEELEA